MIDILTFNDLVEIGENERDRMDVIMDKEQAFQAMARIFNYCEEIDLHLPENERTGYDMLPDVQLVERYILSKDD